MISRISIASIAVLVAGLSFAQQITVPRRPILLTGEVRAIDAQEIHTPPSESSPVVLRYFVPDGAHVAIGDVLVRIDPGAALENARQLGGEIEKAKAVIAKEISELQVQAIDAQISLAEAESKMEVARLDAAIPKDLLARLDYDRYQSEMARATRDVSLKQTELAVARHAILLRQNDGNLELKKLQETLTFNQQQISSAELRADRSGIVSHDFDPYSGDRVDEGSSSNPGQRIGAVIGSGELVVRAYAFEPDRQKLVVGRLARMIFDAWPNKPISGRILDVSSGAESRSNWGNGRYFAVDISLPKPLKLPLEAGMSTRVEIADPEALSQ